MAKICNKCGDSFPSTIKIDNKIRNLCNRKFCLNCSPFNCHNTSVNPSSDPSKNSKICGDVYDSICKKHGNTAFIVEKNGHHRCKICRIESVTNSRKKRKQRLVQVFGGCCSMCGYNKCQRALHFHHIDPSNKSFMISREGSCRAWKRMLKEAEKCILLCANCHAEMHDK